LHYNSYTVEKFRKKEISIYTRNDYAKYLKHPSNSQIKEHVIGCWESRCWNRGGGRMACVNKSLF